MKIVSSLALLAAGMVIGTGAFWIAPKGLAQTLPASWTAIATANSDAGDLPPTNSKRDQAILMLAQAAIEKRLIDPFSAVFENVRIVQGADKTDVVCGYVNAKNRMGAYVGRTAFKYQFLIDYGVLASPDSSEPEEYFRECRPTGTRR